MTNPLDELVLYRMNRARETLEDARVLAKAERWNACVNRLYYTCFYAVSAILIRDGLSSSKHSGIRGLFNKHFVKPGKIPKSMAIIYNDLFERRQEGDYSDFVDFQQSQVLPWISKTEEMLEYIARLLQEKSSESK